MFSPTAVLMSSRVSGVVVVQVWHIGPQIKDLWSNFADWIRFVP